MKTYDDKIRTFVLNLLEDVPYFKNLTEEDKSALQFNFEHKNYKKGSKIQ